MAESSSSSRGRAVAGIDDQLVTAANPTQTDLDGMDYGPCTTIHDYLVDYRLAGAEDSLDLDLDDPAANRDNTFMSTHGTAIPDILLPLHPSVVASLAAARMPTFPFFYFAHGFLHPASDNELEGIFDSGLTDLYSEPDDNDDHDDD